MDTPMTAGGRIYVLASDIQPLVSSYKAAVKEDPKLKAYDESLKQNVGKVVDSMAVQGETRSSEIWSKAFKCVKHTSQLAVDAITESREDEWKDVNLKSLVDAYDESTKETLAFFNTVEKCVKETENSNRILQFAIIEFETQSVDKKYAKTMAELNKFEDIGDPFGEEFAKKLKSVRDKQDRLIEKIKEYEARKESAHKWLKVLFWSAVVTAGVLVIAAIATPVVAAVAGIELTATLVGAEAAAVVTAHGAVAAAAVTAARITDTENELETLGLLQTMAKANALATNTIKLQVDNLKTLISSFLNDMDFVEKHEEAEKAIELAMQQVKGDFEEFTKKIEEVGKSAAECSTSIANGRNKVLKHITGK